MILEKENLLLFLKTCTAKIDQVNLVEIVVFASLFLFLQFGFIDWYFKLAVNFALLTAILTRTKVAFYSEFWAISTLVSAIALFNNWDTADNHKYLFVYWMLVMTLTLWIKELNTQELFLRFNARFLLVLIFLAAALQKSLSQSYMSGEMFELITSLDSRFRAFSVLVGIDVELLDTIKKQFVNIGNPAVELVDNQLTLPITDQIVWIAKWITWYDLYVQILIGVLLIFGRRMTDLWGHIVLLFFIFTTYIPAPVFGFGWTLSTMGLALTWHKFPRLSVIYLTSFIAILIYQVPWRNWVLGMS